MAVAKEQIRQIIADNNLSRVADVYTFLRDGFKDILQEPMEAEMDVALGYEKNQKRGHGDHQQTQRPFPEEAKEPVWGVPN